MKKINNKFWQETKYKGTNPQKLEMYVNKNHYDDWQKKKRNYSEVDRINISRVGDANEFAVTYPKKEMGLLVISDFFQNIEDARDFAKKIMNKMRY